jgi:cation:H+ antiporter
MTDVVLLAAGAVLLYLGAEWLVAGAASLALSLRIPKLIVGLTVVAYGTSAPEAIVGVQSAWTGHGEVAIGNVVGSNITNLGLILGLSALIREVRIDAALRSRELPALLCSAVLLPAVLFDGQVHRWEAGLLLLAALAYTIWTVRASRRATVLQQARQEGVVLAEASETAGGVAPTGRARQALTALLGLAILLVGSHMFVRGATSLALHVGMTERVVGLTIVALGTSLPELVTGIIAAIRGHSDIALGNVIGSNIFNVLVCLSCAAWAGPVAAPPSAFRTDLAVLAAITLFSVVCMRGNGPIRRWQGAALGASYACYTGYLVAFGASGN